jgi:hypothetical protein
LASTKSSVTKQFLLYEVFWVFTRRKKTHKTLYNITTAAESFSHTKQFLSACTLLPFFVAKGPAADATDAPQPLKLTVQPREEDD